MPWKPHSTSSSASWSALTPLSTTREGYREIRLHDPEGTPIRLFVAIPSKTTRKRLPGPARYGTLEALMRLAPSRTMIFALAAVTYASPRRSWPRPRARSKNVSSAPPGRPRRSERRFHLPPGFEIQLVAAEPDIQSRSTSPSTTRGGSGSPTRSNTPTRPRRAREPRDTVKILADFGPDGQARKITTFADGLNIPIGVLPLPDGDEALVYSIPNIYRLRDTDGDGKADRASVFYGAFGSQATPTA